MYSQPCTTPETAAQYYKRSSHCDHLAGLMGSLSLSPQCGCVLIDVPLFSFAKQDHGGLLHVRLVPNCAEIQPWQLRVFAPAMCYRNVCAVIWLLRSAANGAASSLNAQIFNVQLSRSTNTSAAHCIVKADSLRNASIWSRVFG